MGGFMKTVYAFGRFVLFFISFFVLGINFCGLSFAEGLQCNINDLKYKCCYYHGNVGYVCYCAKFGEECGRPDFRTQMINPTKLEGVINSDGNITVTSTVTNMIEAQPAVIEQTSDTVEPSEPRHRNIQK